MSDSSRIKHIIERHFRVHIFKKLTDQLCRQHFAKLEYTFCSNADKNSAFPVHHFFSLFPSMLDHSPGKIDITAFKNILRKKKTQTAGKKNTFASLETVEKCKILKWSAR